VRIPVWIRAVIFIALVPGSVAGWIPWYVAGRPRLDAIPMSGVRGAALVVALAGWMVLLWCARDFARQGRGTPAPYDPPRRLVTAGLYRFVRNPMYVAVVSSIVAQAVWYGSRAVLWYGVGMGLLFHVRVVLFEEPTLASAFGEEFAAYRARVPRWLPRIGSHGPARNFRKPRP
jgi:protein-S-isoprenylcysteine O-methyltransferase Ste14